jgi:hypothetical protein
MTDTNDADGQAGKRRPGPGLLSGLGGSGAAELVAES